MNNKLLTIQEVADILRVSTKTLRRWDQAGRFVPIRTAGNQRRYTQEQVDNYRHHKNSITQPTEQLAPKPLISEKFAPVLPPALNHFPSNSSLRHEFIRRNEDELARLPKTGTVGQIDIRKPFSIEQQVTQVEDEELKVSAGPKFNSGLMFATLFSLILFLVITSLFKYYGTQGINEKKDQIISYINNLYQGKEESEDSSIFVQGDDSQAVLAAAIGDSNFQLSVNVPARFNDVATFSAGLSTNNQDIDAGTGSLTASNVLYDLTAGTGITITAGQTPTIASSGVLSIGGATGAVTLTAGTDITISDTTITNKSTLSSVRGRGGCDGCIVDNDVVNTITISSGGNV